MAINEPNILDRRRHERLRRALASIAKREPRLQRACEDLVRPLDLLARLASLAVDALAGDPRAIERTRVLLALSAATSIGTYSAFASDATASRNQPAVGELTHEAELGSEGTHGDEGEADDLCEPALVHLGWLGFVACAAARSGERYGAANEFLRAVMGLGVSALRAEFLSVSLQSGASEEDLALALGFLAESARIGPGSVLDPAIQCRLRCIQDVHEALAAVVVGQPWESFLVRPVRDVQREGSTLTIRVRATHALKGEPAWSPTPKTTIGVAFIADSEEARAPRVVFAEGSLRGSAHELMISIPEEAQAGWVALTSPDLTRVIELTHQRSKEALEEVNTLLRCLEQQRIPTELFPLHPGPTYLPKREAKASWGSRFEAVDLVQEGAPPYRSGRSIAVVAHLAPPDSGAELLADWGRGPRRVAASHGIAQLTIPEDDVKRGLNVQMELHETGHVDAAMKVPVEVEPWPQDAGYAAITPLLKPVAKRAARGQGATLPHTPADLDQLDVVVDDATGPFANHVLDRLEQTAALTVGLEDFTLLLVLPRGGDQPSILRLEGSGSARAIGIVTEDRIEEALAAAGRMETAPATSRLRLIGRVAGNDISLTEPVRIDERRGAGVGAPYFTSFVASGLDERGIEVVSERVRTHSPTRNGVFSILLAVNESVRAIQFRHKPELFTVELSTKPSLVEVGLRRVDDAALRGPELRHALVPLVERPLAELPLLNRPTGAPRLAHVRIVGDTIQLSHHHSSGARRNLELEVARVLGSRVLWSRVSSQALEPGSPEQIATKLPPGSWQRVRVVLSDGWLATEQNLPGVGLLP